MNQTTKAVLAQSSLGRKSEYISQYTPELLFPIARKHRREEININEQLPFFGYDLWNAFELSWLNQKGKPIVAIGQFLFPCNSPMLIESKSMKLYLNSFNNTKFSSTEEVTQIIANDFSKACGSQIKIELQILPVLNQLEIVILTSHCLDNLDISIEEYAYNPKLLKCSEPIIAESLHTNLFKSNCLVTGQPDWGSIQISYEGPGIDHESLLKYLITYRNHQGFAEHCVEQIFVDILRYCHSQELTVQGLFTRRGGLDINPFRTTLENFTTIRVKRLIRQ